MSATETGSSSDRFPAGALIGSIVAMFCTVVVSIVVLVVFAPRGTDVGPIVTALLGSFATLVPAVLTLMQVRNVKQRQEDADAKLDFLTNGGLDAKARAAIADVVKPSVLKDDDETAALLAADRAHRAAGPAAPGTKGTEA